jgi:hypothetical protein
MEVKLTNQNPQPIIANNKTKKTEKNLFTRITLWFVQQTNSALLVVSKPFKWLYNNISQYTLQLFKKSAASQVIEEKVNRVNTMVGNHIDNLRTHSDECIQRLETVAKTQVKNVFKQSNKFVAENLKRTTTRLNDIAEKNIEKAKETVEEVLQNFFKKSDEFVDKNIEKAKQTVEEVLQDIPRHILENLGKYAKNTIINSVTTITDPIKQNIIDPIEQNIYNAGQQIENFSETVQRAYNVDQAFPTIYEKNDNAIEKQALIEYLRLLIAFLSCGILAEKQTSENRQVVSEETEAVILPELTEEAEAEVQARKANIQVKEATTQIKKSGEKQSFVEKERNSQQKQLLVSTFR